MLRTSFLIASCACLLAALTGCEPEAEPTPATTPTPSAEDKTASSSYDSSMAQGQLGQEVAASDVPQGTVSVADRKPKAGEEVAQLETDKGKILVMFFPDKAPKHVENFKKLIKTGFYNGTKFHRTIPGFMIQGGDPNTKKEDRSLWGTGGPDWSVDAEFNDVHHAKGVLSMARSGDPNSAGSQFFIMVADYPSLNHQYTAFGKVIEGQDVADAIVAGETMGELAKNPVAIKKATLIKWKG